MESVYSSRRFFFVCNYRDHAARDEAILYHVTFVRTEKNEDSAQNRKAVESVVDIKMVCFPTSRATKHNSCFLLFYFRIYSCIN